MGFLLLFEEFIEFHSASHPSTPGHVFSFLLCPAHPPPSHSLICFLTALTPRAPLNGPHLLHSGEFHL